MSRTAAVPINAETKVCSACGLEKPASEFYRRSSGYLRGKCKACFIEESEGRRKAHPEVHAARARRWRSENERRWKDASLRHRFGIGIEDYERMWDEQEGRCLICDCELEGNQPHVDHCNRMLGQARDDAAVLRAGAAYVEARG